MLSIACGIIAFVGGITFLLWADPGSRRLWGIVPPVVWLFGPVFVLGLGEPLANIVALGIHFVAAAIGAKLFNQGRMERFSRIAAAD